MFLAYEWYKLEAKNNLIIVGSDSLGYVCRYQ